MTTDLTFAILAGGRGSRMGVAKDRLAVGGLPILAHLLARAAHGGPTLLVASPAHPTPLGCERFDRVVLDPVEGDGPLAGVVAALAAASTPAVYVLSVDMPNVGPSQLGWLRVVLEQRPGTLGLFGRRYDAAGELRVEPFPSIFSSSAGPRVAAELAAGRRAIHSLLDVPGFAAVDTPVDWPGTVWLNLNRPTDLKEIGATIL